LGNFIESPHNALRDEEAHFEELGNDAAVSSITLAVLWEK